MKTREDDIRFFETDQDKKYTVVKDKTDLIAVRMNTAHLQT